MFKIVIIGVGSGVFIRNLVRDILLYLELRDFIIVFMDIDSIRFEFMRKVL